MSHSRPVPRFVTVVALLLVGPVFAQTLDAPLQEVASPPSRWVIDEKQDQRLRLLTRRDRAAAGLKWAASAVGVAGAFCVLGWVLALTNTSFSVYPLNLAHQDSTPSQRDGALIASVTSLAFAGLLALTSGLIGRGVDDERAELERKHWVPKSEAEERRSLGLTPEADP